jgi:hypothetical protein
MVQEAQAGDSLVFFFAGHGTQVPDDGEEADQYDEAICPADNSLITDDDLRNILINLPEGAKFTMISGACFAKSVCKRGLLATRVVARGHCCMAVLLCAMLPYIKPMPTYLSCTI